MKLEAIDKADVFLNVAQKNAVLKKTIIYEVIGHPSVATEDDLLELIAGLLKLFAPCQIFILSLHGSIPSRDVMADLAVPYRNRGLKRRVTLLRKPGRGKLEHVMI